MNNIVVIKTQVAQPDLTTLDDVLSDFVKYGRPRLQCMDSMKWYCAIEVFVTGKGIEFKVESDFKQPTPLSAARQCHYRMLDALRDIAKMM